MVGAVAAWVVLVTALHVTLNVRGVFSRTAEARALPVGGLAVT